VPHLKTDPCRNTFTLKFKTMNLENQLLEKFQVEELEKRYQFAWVESVGGFVMTDSGTIKVAVAL
jgi:hypothetical protein